MTDLVHFHVEYPGRERDRWGTVFRPVLAIPHAIFVGGPLVGFGARAWNAGALGTLALICAIVDSQFPSFSLSAEAGRTEPVFAGDA